MNQRRTRRRAAFTLMEILLVLAILVVLASMVTLGYSQIQKGANIKAAKTQLNLLESAVNAYSIDVGTLPSNLEALVQVPGDLPRPDKWSGPYLAKTNLPVDPWNQPYQYEITDQSTGKFRIWSNGPDLQPGSSDDVSTTQ
jgi:general secretion pathway protein G